MSGRSPSGGVASLRARFEENTKSESPPSRGRSPAGSITSASSRPISKVRTSFISVEPSGQMGDFLGTKDLLKPETAAVGDSAEESKGISGGADVEGENRGRAQTAAPAPSRPEEDSSATTTNMDLLSSGNTPASHTDKTLSATDESTASPATPDISGKNEISSAADKLTGNVADLGSILKGSSFEKEQIQAPKDESPLPKPESVSQPQATTTVTRPAKPSTAPTSVVNGKPKDTRSAEPNITAPSEKTEGAVSKETKRIHKISDVSKTGPAKEEIETKPAQPKIAPSVDSFVAKGIKSSTRPRTPPGITAPAKEAIPAAASLSSPDQPIPAKSEVEQVKATSKPEVGDPPAESPTSEGILAPKTNESAKTKKIGDGVTSKPSPSKEVRMSNAKSTKPSNPTTATASSTGFMKPKPRSPTRPAKLPSHLTAPTAASAAKLDHSAPAASQPARSPSRTSNVPATSKPNAFKKPSTGAAAAQRLKRPPRASMPVPGAISKPTEKPKARQSMAGGSRPSTGSNSFLERMMRPTQSSAQKTHEKVEVGKQSPPRKTGTASGGSRSASLNVDDKKKARVPASTQPVSAAGTKKEEVSSAIPSAEPSKETQAADADEGEAPQAPQDADPKPVPSESTASIPSAEKPSMSQPVTNAGETF